MKDFQKRKTWLVLGGGLSGAAASRLLLKQNKRLFLTDDKGFDPSLQKELGDKGATFLKPNQVDFHQQDIQAILLSPGVPLTHPLVLAAEKNGIPWISEIDLAMLFMKTKVVGITGTNGKSTTCAMTAHLLCSYGLKAVAAGNIGEPPTALVEREEAYDVVVLELSSYQLEHSKGVKVDVGVFHNFSFDHQERHKTLERYFAAKWNLFKTLQKKGQALLSQDVLARALELQCSIPKQKLAYLKTPYDQKRLPLGVFGTAMELDEDGAFSGLDLNQGLDLSVFDLSYHNIVNGIYASLAAQHFLDESFLEIFARLKTFQALPFRFETVGKYRDALIINDSKATNVDATVAALQCVRRPVLLLLGGVGKGESYIPLLRFKERIKGVICFGKTGEQIYQELQGALPCRKFATLKEAIINVGQELAAQPTDVLFSPACASFDEFKNFEDRGRFFTSEMQKVISNLS